ncbi:MAG TPA: hypothetical protein VFU14_00935 [Acidimicrobiales bacterium]|nr:hypothetical protein [Acidimicrobiales bacterium]
MPVHPRPGARLVALAAVALLVTGCGTARAGSPPDHDGVGPRQRAVDPAATSGPDPDADPPEVGAVAGVPHELLLTGDLRALAAGRPDADDAVVELRLVVAGGRQHVTTSVGGRVVDQHVATADEHWMWIPPDLRGDLVDAEWVHLDVGALEDAGLPLPPHVAAARGSAPVPDDVEVGDVVGGMEVLGVEPLPGDAVRLRLADLPVPMTLRRRPLPAGTEVELPTGAVDASEVSALLGG